MTPNIEQAAEKLIEALHNKFGEWFITDFQTKDQEMAIIIRHLTTHTQSLGEENKRLREALLLWKAYFQSDIPKSRDEHEQSGEQFTEAWFTMEKALTKPT